MNWQVSILENRYFAVYIESIAWTRKTKDVFFSSPLFSYSACYQISLVQASTLLNYNIEIT